jgi:hypothetical protein
MGEEGAFWAGDLLEGAMVGDEISEANWTLRKSCGWKGGGKQNVGDAGDFGGWIWKAGDLSVLGFRCGAAEAEDPQ